MTAIRPFDSYRDAAKACIEAGFRFTRDSNTNNGGRSFAPTLTYTHPETGEQVEVLWAHDRGAIRRLAAS